MDQIGHPRKWSLPSGIGIDVLILVTAAATTTTTTVITAILYT